MDQLEQAAAPDASDDADALLRLPWWQSKLNLAVVAVAIAVLCGGFGWLIGNNRAMPDPNTTDLGFLQDMRAHHEQAVYLSLYYLSDSGTNPNLRDIAREIVFGQGIEIGRMVEMLREFGANETNGTEYCDALDERADSHRPHARTCLRCRHHQASVEQRK